MAKQVREILIDDLDGGEAVETVSFAVDGSSYEIDLSGDNASRLRDVLSPFVKHARKTAAAPGVRRQRRGQVAMSRERSAAIRAWAREHNLPVSGRGRIASTVVEKYDAAH